MKKALPIIFFLIVAFFSCRTSDQVSQLEQSGAELWALNCSRCHTIPSPTEFTSHHWEIISTHMRLRAGLDEKEMKKITAFLQMSSGAIE